MHVVGSFFKNIGTCKVYLDISTAQKGKPTYEERDGSAAVY